MTDQEKAELWIRQGRVLAAERLPWLAPALFGARLLMSERLPTIAGVDAEGRVYFNPRFLREPERGLEELLEDLAFIWYHEVAHVLREHRARREVLQAEPSVWNLATDLEINDGVPQGLRLPKLVQGMLPRHYGLPGDKLAEWYYARLREKAKEAPETPQSAIGLPRPAPEREGGPAYASSPEPPSREATGSAQASDTETDVLEEGERAFPQDVPETPWPEMSESSTWPTDAPQGLDAGSGIDGVPREWELQEGDEPGLSELELELLRRQVAEEIERALKDPKQRGTIPAGWARWAAQVLQPRVDWRRQFMRAVRGAIRQGWGQKLDYSWRRPSRRSGALEPFIPPILQGERVPRVAVVVDTSGSISDRELEQALGEIAGMLHALGMPITLIPCDAVPYEPLKVFHHRQLSQVKLPGGGGTDMVAGIAAALRMHPEPDTVIVLTDGYTPFPQKRYRVPVVFGIFKVGDSDPPTPPVSPFRPEEVILIPVSEAEAYR